MFDKQTLLLTSNGKPVKVHLVSAGSVAVKTKFRDARRKGWLAMLDFILDKHFTEWLPIWVMIIEHPEGIFVIDTGEITDVNKTDYFKSSGLFAKWFDTSQFKFSITRDEEIDMQLNALGIKTDQVKTVVLIHLHFDHTDGVKYFPSAEIIVNKHEWEKPFGDLPKLYPSWFSPTLVELSEAYDMFSNVKYLTKAKDIMLVHTAGHTYGHCSVLLRTNEADIFFAADVSYSQQQLLDEKFPGNYADNNLAFKTYRTIKAYSKDHPLVFIPSHEAAAANRFKKLITLTISSS